MKKIVSSLIVSTALVSTLSAKDFYASIDGDKITKQDVLMVLPDPRIDFEKLPKSAQDKVIEQIINKKLVSKNALKNGIENDKEYKKTLKAMKEDLAFQVWQKNELKKIKVTDSEKKDFYNKNKDKFVEPALLSARHILLKTEKEAKNIIAKLKKASNKEKTFIELAKTKSTGPSASNGGDLGTFSAEQMVPEFSAAAQSLSKGSFSKKPVKTQFGYHVIYLKDKKASKTMSYDEVKNNISQILTGKRYNDKVKK